MNELLDKIINQEPFECSNLDVLCSAIAEVYEPAWGNSLIWILGCLRKMKQFEKCNGSWNVPLWHVAQTYDEVECYKVFRKPNPLPLFPKENYDEIVYEFHPNKVHPNKWMQAEVSGSGRLTGLCPESAKFHMLMNANQAFAYLESRRHCVAYHDYTPYISKVKARRLVTVDLVYSPPKQWVWGVDAKEMYVSL